MKKISIVMLMVATTMALPTSLHAQSWGGLLKQAVEKVTGDATNAKNAVKEKAKSTQQQAVDTAKSKIQNVVGKVTSTTQQNRSADRSGRFIARHTQQWKRTWLTYRKCCKYHKRMVDRHHSTHRSAAYWKLGI